MNRVNLKYLKAFDDYFKLNEAIDVDARDQIRNAIGLIFINLPFFSSILIRLWIVEDASPSNPTMYTNGKVIAYNPNFVNSLTTGEVSWVLCHEIMHNVLLHFSRQKPNADLWNQAADYAINLLLTPLDPKKPNMFTMPDGGLYDEKYKDMTAEAIYDFLEKNPNQQKKNYNNFGKVTNQKIEVDPDNVVQKGTSGKINDEEDGKSGSGEGDKNDQKAGNQMIEIEVGSEIEINSIVQQSIGKASMSIRRYYELLFKSKVDWKKELKRYVREILDKIKYKLPYRRFIYKDKYLSGPVRKGDSLENVVVAVDTSGSIDGKMINEFLTEVAGMISSYRIENLWVLPIDTKIHHENRFKNPRDIKNLNIVIKGGGGTDFKPVFHWIDHKLRKQFAVLIYLTDAIGSFPNTPEYASKIIWCVKGPGKVPFGKRVAMDDN